jgi:hypothetical protein
VSVIAHAHAWEFPVFVNGNMGESLKCYNRVQYMVIISYKCIDNMVLCRDIVCYRLDLLYYVLMMIYFDHGLGCIEHNMRLDAIGFYYVLLYIINI